ncbi:MAG: toll/interleukin-1 receptor domain-containing protein [Cyanobacteria bacterium P01_D01_bin.6]
MQEYAFASYSHRDADAVMPIVEALLERGFYVWIDRLQLVPGEEWGKSISEALRDAKALLWFAGRHTGSSSWMQEELRSTMRLGEQVALIPVLVKGANPEELPLFLKTRQWVDARDDRNKAIDALSTALTQYLGSPLPPIEKETFSQKNEGYFFISYSVEDSEFLDDLKSFLKQKGYGY